VRLIDIGVTPLLAVRKVVMGLLLAYIICTHDSTFPVGLTHMVRDIYTDEYTH